MASDSSEALEGCGNSDISESDHLCGPCSQLQEGGVVRQELGVAASTQTRRAAPPCAGVALWLTQLPVDQVEVSSAGVADSNSRTHDVDEGREVPDDDGRGGGESRRQLDQVEGSASPVPATPDQTSIEEQEQATADMFAKALSDWVIGGPMRACRRRLRRRRRSRRTP